MIFIHLLPVQIAADGVSRSAQRRDGLSSRLTPDLFAARG